MIIQNGTGQPTNGGQPTAGWSAPFNANDRPKSAGISSTATGGNSGLIASLTGAGRPSSSTQPVSNSNWNATGGNGPQNNTTNNNNTNSTGNTLSYGNLKNRFLSGASKNNATTTGTGNTGVQVLTVTMIINFRTINIIFCVCFIEYYYHWSWFWCTTNKSINWKKFL